MSEDKNIVIRPAYADEYETVMGLAWKTFLRFDAGDFPKQGIDSFRDFLTSETLKKLYDTGQYPIFVAQIDDQIRGVISLRNMTHISLLFVEADYHRRGIGRRLIEHVCGYVEEQLHHFMVTVNSAAYATEFYHRLGFTDLGGEIAQNGVRFTPMSLLLTNMERDGE